MLKLIYWMLPHHTISTRLNDVAGQSQLGAQPSLHHRFHHTYYHLDTNTDITSPLPPSLGQCFRALHDVDLNKYKEFRVHVGRAHHSRPSLKHANHHIEVYPIPKQPAELSPEVTWAGKQDGTMVYSMFILQWHHLFRTPLAGSSISKDSPSCLTQSRTFRCKLGPREWLEQKQSRARHNKHLWLLVRTAYCQPLWNTSKYQVRL